MGLTDVLLAPLRIPVRVVRALDDLSALAERARRDPDPMEQVRDRVDLLLAELAVAVEVAREIVDGGAELTATAKRANVLMQRLEDTGERLHGGGQDLLEVSRRLEGDTRELIDGGDRLRQVTERMEADLRVFRSAMPRVLAGLDTVEELEDAVETVADTVEPLQGAAERVGRVTDRFSRRRD